MLSHVLSATRATAVITECIPSRSVHSICLFHICLGVVKSGLPRSQSESATGFTGSSRRHGRSREEQRRHTISNGVDYGVVCTHTHTQTQTQQSATPGFQKETFLDVCLCDVFNLLLVNQQPSHGLTLVVQRSAVVLPGFY